MKISIALLALILIRSSFSYDFYIIRHGARAPLGANLPLIFGVPIEQLTAAGRSQAFYLGQELKMRHPNITDDGLLVDSTDVDRTKETAQFFLKGWFGLEDKSATTGEHNQTLIRFNANPRFLPPGNLTFKPKPTIALVKWFVYKSKVAVLPKEENKSRQPALPPLTDEEQAIQKRLNSSKLCEKAKILAPELCAGRNPYFLVSDLITCLEFEGLKMPTFTKAEIELAHIATDLHYGLKYGKYAARNQKAFAALNRFSKHFVEQTKKVVFEFSHDTNIFGMLRTLLGHEEFLRLMKPHIIIDFLSMLRFRVRDRTVKLFFNDTEIPLQRCFEGGNAVCRIDTFLRMIDQKLF